MSLDDLLKELQTTTTEEFANKPAVEAGSDGLDVHDLPINVRKWIQMDDIVAVVADLQNSTRMGTGKHAASTASMYAAGTGGVVKIFNHFQADYLQIQGDGAFALFWGDSRYERALCAGITVKTMSLDFAEKITRKWSTGPETGFKVGIASGRVLVKRIGTSRNHDQQAPVWAGKPVNYAAKAAQGVDRHELIVTQSVWDAIEDNDYLRMSCSCNGKPSTDIWEPSVIGKIPEDDTERDGQILYSSWCAHHGAEYCDAILHGDTTRDETKAIRQALQQQLRNAITEKHHRHRQNNTNRSRGLR